MAEEQVPGPYPGPLRWMLRWRAACRGVLLGRGVLSGPQLGRERKQDCRREVGQQSPSVDPQGALEPRWSCPVVLSEGQGARPDTLH